MDMSGCEQLETAGAWVLGAVGEHEAAGYAEHLRTCADCQAEVARLRPPADALALASEQVPPPPALRDRIMLVVESEAQLLRATGPEADQPQPQSQPQRKPSRERRWFLRPIPVAALAAAALAVGVGVGLLVSGGQSTRTIQAQVAMSGARATISVTGDHAKLEVSGMRNPPPGHVYQVWVKRGSAAPRPTDALFTVNSSGHGHIEVPGSVKGVNTIMVTAEPAGGSTTPTLPAVITAPV
jgi:anti-sigma-K factor RskA